MCWFFRSSRVSVQHPFDYHNSQQPQQHNQHAHHHRHHHHHHHHEQHQQRSGIRKTSIKNGQRHLKNAEGVSGVVSVGCFQSLIIMNGLQCRSDGWANKSGPYARKWLSQTPHALLLNRVLLGTIRAPYIKSALYKFSIYHRTFSSTSGMCLLGGKDH